MYEYIVSVFACDEAIALLSALNHFTVPLFIVSYLHKIKK